MKYLLSLFVCICCLHQLGIAQRIEFSPLSKYGLGNPQNQNTFPLQSMGGIGVGYYTIDQLNISNPASYSWLRYTSFEIGTDLRMRSITGKNDQTNRYWSGNLSYLLLGIPLQNPINEALDKKKRTTYSGLAFGLIPFTQISYNLVQVDSTNTDLGIVETQFLGSGGTYKLMGGYSYKYKNFSAGLNLNYIFGNLHYTHKSGAVFVTNSNTNFLNDDYHISGFNYDLGILYDKAIKTKRIDNKIIAQDKLIAGLTFGTKTNYSADIERLYITQNNIATSFHDTVVNETVNNVKGSFPMHLGLGLTYRSSNKFEVAGQYQFSQWSKAKLITDRNNKLKDQSIVSIGASYRPNASDFAHFLNRVVYRIGFDYEKDPRVPVLDQVTRYGFHYGMSLPVYFQRQQSWIHLGLSGGKMGTDDSIQEWYGKFSFGVSLNDNEWFLKRRYN